jgi:nucleotide-binding universal stress UspA family protein
MTTLRRILCATDLSSASGPAWGFAQRLALATKADLLLLNVVPWLPVPLEGAFDPQTYQRLTDEGREEALTELDRLAHGDVDPSLRIVVRVEDGPAASRILAIAELEGADVVVLGTHGRTGLNRLFVGSVAEQVVQLAKCPVVTVRPLPEPEGRPARPLARLLYPTDFSPASRRAWPWARAIAEASGADVELVHVMIEVVPDRHMDPAMLARAAAAIREDAQRSADEFVADCGLPRERVAVHLAHGVEAEQVVHRAQARGADLIVMGTHGRTGLVRLALGSVTRRVLHTAPCAVLTVGPHVAETSSAA